MGKMSIYLLQILRILGEDGLSPLKFVNAYSFSHKEK